MMIGMMRRSSPSKTNISQSSDEPLIFLIYMFEEFGWFEWVAIALVIVVLYVAYQVREFKKMDAEIA